MTTTDAAAARRHRLLVALAVVIGFAGLGLAGCGSSLFEAANNTTQEPAAAPKAAVESRRQGRAEFDRRASRRAGQAAASGVCLRARQAARHGNRQQGRDALISTCAPTSWPPRKRTGPRFPTCSMSATPTGKRVNRFTGEEMVPGNPSRDPWAAITPPVAQSITAKATGSFVAWLPSARAAIASAPRTRRPASRCRRSEGRHASRHGEGCVRPRRPKPQRRQPRLRRHRRRTRRRAASTGRAVRSRLSFRRLPVHPAMAASRSQPPSSANCRARV